MKQAIKILVISNYKDTISVRPEAEIYIGLAKMGVEICIMTFEDCVYNSDFRAAGIKVIGFHPEKKFDKKEIGFIRQEIQKEKYDALFLYNSIATINGIRAAKGLSTKIILYRGFEGHIHWYDPTAYLKYLHRRVDYIICNSKGIETYFKKNTFINKNKLITINKGHELSWYKDVIAHSRKDFGFKESDFLLICVANNRKMKGMPYMLKAMNELPKGLAIHLLLVGNGMDDEELTEIKNSSPYRENIHVLGFRKDALELVAMSDVFVLSSIFGESITKAVIEAMSLGIAPIITDIPGNVELVNQDMNGIVVPKANSSALAKAILQLYEDRDLANHFGKQSKVHIQQKLSNHRSIQEMHRFLDKITDKG